MSIAKLNLSPMVKRRIGIAAAVFASAFLSSYLAAKGGIGVDTIFAAFSAGVAALAHWAVNQLAPVIEKNDTIGLIGAQPVTAVPGRPGDVPSPGNPPVPGA